MSTLWTFKESRLRLDSWCHHELIWVSFWSACKVVLLSSLCFVWFSLGEFSVAAKCLITCRLAPNRLAPNQKSPFTLRERETDCVFDFWFGAKRPGANRLGAKRRTIYTDRNFWNICVNGKQPLSLYTLTNSPRCSQQQRRANSKTRRWRWLWCRI